MKNFEKDLVTLIKKGNNNIVDPEIEFIETQTKVFEETMKDIIASRELKIPINVLFIGPASTGKNVLVENISALLGDDTISFSCSEGTEEVSLIGGLSLKDNSTYFKEGPLLKAMREGSIFLADEINTLSPDILSKLHSLLDDRRSIYVNGEEYHAHENFIFIGTMNENYEGTKALNEAFNSRFLKKYLHFDMDIYSKIVDSFNISIKTKDFLISEFPKYLKEEKIFIRNIKKIIEIYQNAKGEFSLVELLDYIDDKEMSFDLKEKLKEIRYSVDDDFVMDNQDVDSSGIEDLF